MTCHVTHDSILEAFFMEDLLIQNKANKLTN